jgi:nucleoid DNA-binding protein
MTTFSIAEMEKYLISRFSEKTNVDFPTWIFKDIPRVICEGIRERILNGDKIRIERVGVIEPCDKRPRVGRNPRSGETVRIPAKKGVRLKVSDELVRELNGSPKLRVVKRVRKPTLFDGKKETDLTIKAG